MLTVGLFIWAVVNLLLTFKVDLGAAELLVMPALVVAYGLIAIATGLSLIPKRRANR